MTARTVRFCVTCTTDDPQVAARVMGLLAARNLLPLSFTSTRLPTERVAIEIIVEESEELQTFHLARLFDRLQVVVDVEVEIDGAIMPFRHSSPSPLGEGRGEGP